MLPTLEVSTVSPVAREGLRSTGVSAVTLTDCPYPPAAHARNKIERHIEFIVRLMSIYDLHQPRLLGLLAPGSNPAC
jgi:hypothetical protein